jgi:hypothetical protein
MADQVIQLGINKSPIVAYLCAIGTHKLATLDILNHIQQLKQL